MKTEENVLTSIHFIELITLVYSSRPTIYTSQDRNVFLIMMLANYLTQKFKVLWC